MKSTNRILLGFDARLDVGDDGWPAWTPEWRGIMLLRPEVTLPLSVDSNIWPTHFEYYPALPHSTEQTAPLLVVDPDVTGGLWPSLSAMKRCLTVNRRQAVLLAIEVVFELVQPGGVSYRGFSSPMEWSIREPAEMPEGSIFLGYDVGNDGCLSGLSNCGYQKEEMEALRSNWCGRINDFGLIRSEQDAHEFRILTENRTPEHGPFWVYGLYRLS